MNTRKPKAILGRYVLPFALFAALAAVLAIGITGWTPVSWIDWLALGALVPAGGGGALLGDKVGLWLKENGVGRR